MKPGPRGRHPARSPEHSSQGDGDRAKLKGRRTEDRRRATVPEAPASPTQLPEEGKTSIKDLLLAMPPGGEDSDFERSPDLSRDRPRFP